MVQEQPTKECRACKQSVPIDCYYKTGKNGKWLMRDCKVCFHKKRRERYKNDSIFREKIHQELLQWRRTHKEHTNATCSRWHKANRIKLNHYRNKRYAIKKYDPVFKMIKTHRARIYKTLNIKNIYKNESSIKLLGCSPVQLKNYILSKFQPGMTWENHGRFGWHVDHIIPLSCFDFSDPAQIKKAFHYTNLQPMWWLDNLKKGNKAVA